MTHCKNAISGRAVRKLCVALALTVSVFGAEPKIVVPPYNKMSDAEEIRLGQEAADGIEKEEHLKFLEEDSVRDYVHAIFHKIYKSSGRSNLPYSIKIVDTKEINAFALPGGHIYLNRGLLEFAQSESQLASVLAHEVGHVVGHHGANEISRQASADSLITEASRMIFGDDLPGQLLKQAGGPLFFIITMKYSREQELQADLLGYHNMQRAGWDPKGMVELFHRFAEQEGGFNPLFTIGSTHPPSSEREAQIRDEWKESPPRPGLRNDSEDFKRVQAVVKRLPPPQTQQKIFN
jgi:predicted Zn-dependent protease